MKPRLTVDNALERLRENPDREFARLFRRGAVEIDIYRPRGIDRQTPHERDEVYVVIAGSGDFVQDGDRHEVVPGEVLFVPAGSEHRFEDFTDDFATWVIFFGPEEGDRP